MLEQYHFTVVLLHKQLHLFLLLNRLCVLLHRLLHLSLRLNTVFAVKGQLTAYEVNDLEHLCQVLLKSDSVTEIDRMTHVFET